MATTKPYYAVGNGHRIYANDDGIRVDGNVQDITNWTVTITLVRPDGSIPTGFPKTCTKVAGTGGLAYYDLLVGDLDVPGEWSRYFTLNDGVTAPVNSKPVLFFVNELTTKYPKESF